MFGGLFGLLAEFSGRISIFIVPVTEYKTGLNWSAITSNFVGGIATILAALLVFWLGNRTDQNKRYEESRKIGAAHALSGYFKLSKWANLLANIDHHIDRAYQNARESGLNAREPFVMVGPTAGKFTQPELLTSKEYSFLLTKDSFELVADVGLLEERAMNLLHLFQQYSEMHLEFQVWLDGLPGFDRKLDGAIATDKIPEEYVERFNSRGAQLNQILNGVIEHLEGDIAFSIKTTQRFVDAANGCYNPYFPKIEFENNRTRVEIKQ